MFDSNILALFWAHFKVFVVFCVRIMYKGEYMQTTIDRLHHLRKNVLRITQAEFSAAIGISRSNLANIEKGHIGLSGRIVRDVCREFAVRKAWLLEGQEPIFEPRAGDGKNSIGTLFGRLSENNQRAIENQIQLLLHGQESLAAAFAGGEAVKDEELTGEEIRLLKEMLAKRDAPAPKKPAGGER